MLNKGVYTDTELNSLIETELKSQMLDFCNDILRTNKLEKVTKMVISLNEQTQQMADGRPSNILFTYYVTSSECYTLSEPQTPRYMKLKYGEIFSLTLRTDQNNDIITVGRR